MYSKADAVEPTRIKFVIPSFTLASSSWAGASVILSEFPFENSEYLFSLKVPISSFGSYFIPAIRWVKDGVISRFKLWEDDLAVLMYPVYDGERIGLNSVLEIWSINTTSAPVLLSNKIVYSSVLVFPESDSNCCCCDIPDESITLIQSAASPLPPSAYCNPFCNGIC